jgi:hypothetical protein
VPTTLLYGDPYPGSPISAIGVYDAKPRDLPTANDFPRLESLKCPIREDYVYHSRASLNNVKYARIFYGEEAYYCKGILLQYDDGSQQTVGQCRLNVSLEKINFSPSMICHRTVKLQYEDGVVVDFATEPVKNSDWTGWGRSMMSGRINFWFTCDSAVLVIDYGSKVEM